MNKPTPSKNIRLTISVSPEVHETFQRLSSATGMSIGRGMGEWLADTLDAAQLVSSQVERARSAPSLVVREMQAFARGLADETDTLMDHLRAKGKSDRLVAHAKQARPARRNNPPSL